MEEAKYSQGQTWPSHHSFSYSLEVCLILVVIYFSMWEGTWPFLVETRRLSHKIIWEWVFLGLKDETDYAHDSTFRTALKDILKKQMQFYGQWKLVSKLRFTMDLAIWCLFIDWDTSEMNFPSKRCFTDLSNAFSKTFYNDRSFL